MRLKTAGSLTTGNLTAFEANLVYDVGAKLIHGHICYCESHVEPDQSLQDSFDVLRHNVRRGPRNARYYFLTNRRGLKIF